MKDQTPKPRPLESWNERYSTAEYVFGTAPNDFVAEVANRIPPGPVLCIAEGEGRNAVFLAGLGHPTVAMDQSPVGLGKARALAEANGVTISTVAADLAEFVIDPGGWAAIVSVFCHIPPDLRANVYGRAVEGLQPGGVFILEAYTPKQIGNGTGGPRDPRLTPTLEQLRRELAGLDFEIGVERRREVIEGPGHTGMAEVVQVLARKPATAS